MHKYQILFMTLLLLAWQMPAQGQGGYRRIIHLAEKGISKETQAFSRKLPGKTISKNSEELSRQLAKRAQESLWRTYSKQLNLPQAKAWHWPSATLSAPLTVDPTVLYPYAPFLQNSAQLTNYFLTKNNLEIMKFLPKFQERQQFITNHLEDFIRAKRRITHLPQQDMMWLSAQVHPHTDYLLLGEVHQEPAVQRNIATFIQHLRQRFPQRTIFMFSEFLPQDIPWEQVLSLPRFPIPYIRVWTECSFANIPVVGLEPNFVVDMPYPLIVSAESLALPGSMQHTKPMWATVEGTRLRNQQWMQLLRQYRQEYPDALFVVHAGTAHVEYNEPYSLGSQLAKERTQVFTFEVPHQPSDFHQLTNNQFKDRILQFQNKKLSHMAGFDISIKIQPRPTPIPEDLENIRL